MTHPTGRKEDGAEGAPVTQGGGVDGAVKRVTYRITDQNPAHVRFSMWVNGGLICSPGGMCLRVSEFAQFMGKLEAYPDSEI